MAFLRPYTSIGRQGLQSAHGIPRFHQAGHVVILQLLQPQVGNSLLLPHRLCFDLGNDIYIKKWIKCWNVASARKQR